MSKKGTVMHLTDDERTKTRKAITRLEQEIKTLENKLKELSDLHVSAWKEYGSELCGGEMIDDERKLESEIERKKGFIFTMEKILLGTFDVSPERVAELKKELGDRRRRIENAQTYLKTLEGHLAHIHEVKRIAGIT